MNVFKTFTLYFILMTFLTSLCATFYLSVVTIVSHLTADDNNIWVGDGGLNLSICGCILGVSGLLVFLLVWGLYMPEEDEPIVEEAGANDE